LAKDIFANNYESHREPVELKFVSQLQKGNDLTCFCFVANKGASRVNVLWFGVLWTYFHLKMDMNDDMNNEFDRPGLGNGWIKSITF